MMALRNMLRLSSCTELFSRAIRLFSPRCESSFNALQFALYRPGRSLKSLSRIPLVDGVRGLEDLKGCSYLHDNAGEKRNFNAEPRIMGNLGANFDRNRVKEFETGQRSRSMDFVRGIIQGDGNYGAAGVGSQFSQSGVEKNADIVHVKLLRNNTFVTITDSKGETKASASSGCLSEMKGGPKLSRYAAEATAEHVGRMARKLGVKSVVMKVNGFTYFKKKKQAILSFKEGYTHSRGDVNPIVYIEDTTRKPHNGCRRRKRRRV